jgi:hypothetical protein
MKSEFSTSPEGAQSSLTENVACPYPAEPPEKWHFHFHLLANNFRSEAFLPN